jgi:hypothetical protein
MPLVGIAHQEQRGVLDVLLIAGAVLEIELQLCNESRHVPLILSGMGMLGAFRPEAGAVAGAVFSYSSTLFCMSLMVCAICASRAVRGSSAMARIYGEKAILRCLMKLVPGLHHVRPQLWLRKCELGRAPEQASGSQAWRAEHRAQLFIGAAFIAVVSRAFNSTLQLRVSRQVAPCELLIAHPSRHCEATLLLKHTNTS